MPTLSDAVMAAAIEAYGETKHDRVDRDRLRRAITAATATAFNEGYRKGFEAAEYDDANAINWNPNRID